MIEKIDKLIERVSTLKAQRVLLGSALFVTLVLVYILNVYFPLMLDDWAYSLVYAEGVGRKVASLQDIFQSQYTHYFSWGGRSIVHAIAQFLLLIGPFWHDILNTLALVALLYVFYKISNYGKPANVFVYMLLCLLMWFLQPGFASVYFWITGSANYMWGMLIIIAFLYPYYTYYRGEVSKSGSSVTAILYLLFGVVAGWTNENMSLAIIAFIAFFFYLVVKEKRKIPLWSILGFVGILIGTIIMLKAPGNYNRFEFESLERGLDPSEGMINIKNIIMRIPNMLFLYFKRLLFIVAPYLVLLYFFKKQDVEIERKRKILNVSYLFFFAANIAFFAMIGSLVFPSRAYFGILCLFSLAFGILFANFNFQKSVSKRIMIGILALATIAFLGDYYFAKYKKIKLIDTTLANREKVVVEGMKNGQRSFVFHDGLKVSNRLFFGDCSDDPDYWVNKLYTNYYGIDSVKVYFEDKK